MLRPVPVPLAYNRTPFVSPSRVSILLFFLSVLIFFLLFPLVFDSYSIFFLLPLSVFFFCFLFFHFLFFSLFCVSYSLIKILLGSSRNPFILFISFLLSFTSSPAIFFFNCAIFFFFLSLFSFLTSLLHLFLPSFSYLYLLLSNSFLSLSFNCFFGFILSLPFFLFLTPFRYPFPSFSSSFPILSLLL